MTVFFPTTRFASLLAAFATSLCCHAIDLEVIGVTALRREHPALTGAGVRIAQPEAEVSPGAWQVDPSVNTFVSYSWTSGGGTTNNFPNELGSASYHAVSVGQVMYGTNYGVAPGMTSVDSYEAAFFINSIVVPRQSIRARIINQSFILGNPPSTVDPLYDGYTESFDVLFISGMNNAPDSPPTPGTAYNGIGVGLNFPGFQSSIGPTADGRSKPDLVSVEPVTSLATPDVAGAAALLLQAAAAGDGGAGTPPLATNATLIKALLLNGAVKPTNWTNGVSRPLDARHGAGVLNVYNSDRQLRGGRSAALATNNVPLNAPHPPMGSSSNIVPPLGWDVATIQSTVANDRVAHYFFTLPAETGPHSAVATLVWKKIGAGALTNLDLFLYHAANSNLIIASTSLVDNVEHIFVPNLPPGRYDLQVLKRGGVGLGGGQAYALAFDFSPVRILARQTGVNDLLAWASSPAGFVLQSASSLNTPINWQFVTNQSLLSNGQNTVTLPASAANRFFRLFRP